MTTNTDTTAASGAATLGPLNDRAIKDAIRGAYDLGYNDARIARTVPGDSAPGYKGRDAERDHGGALIHGLSRALAAPAAQEAEPAVPVEPTDEMYVAAGAVELPTGDDDGGSIHLNTSQVRQIWQAMRAALYAHPPRPQADAGAVPTDDDVNEAIEWEFSESHEWPEGDGATVRAFLKHWPGVKAAKIAGEKSS